MKNKTKTILLSIVVALSLGTQVDCGEPMNIHLNDYLWKNRILLFFALIRFDVQSYRQHEKTS
jgi:hypothetical protein